MSDELKQAVTIGIELFVFSLLILIVACFGLFADRAFNIKTMEDTTRTEIVEFRNIYEFTNGCEEDIDVLRETYNIKKNTSGTFNNITETFAKQHGTEVTGDDILRFVGKYTFEYDIVIYTTSFSMGLNKETEPDGWLLTDLSNKFNEKLSNTFYCFAIYDTYNYKYDSIVFYEKRT